jgi:hypothetical protein
MDKASEHLLHYRHIPLDIVLMFYHNLQEAACPLYREELDERVGRLIRCKVFKNY